MSFKRLIYLFLAAFTLVGGAVTAQAQDAEKAAATTENAEGKPGGKKLDIAGVIFGHIADAHEWHWFTIEHEGAPATEVATPLPVIIYNPEKGLSIFSSNKLAEGAEYEGYHLVRGSMKEKVKVVGNDDAKIYDFSITKNVMSMLISVVLLLWIMLSIAKKYKKNGIMAAPSGTQNAMEGIILFLRDEVARPNLGHKANKYFPLLLTIFFFVWINNLLGLLPGGANFTGNIAFTGCLAIISFIVMMASSNKHYWSHLLNPPAPIGIKFLLVPIEIMSMFIKPMALMIRLFANMIAGHIGILAVICMIFIFGALNKYIGFGFVPVSLAFSIFMFLLELLVGAIQAFIFANLTAVFIGQAIEGDHSNDATGQDYHVNEGEIIA